MEIYCSPVDESFKCKICELFPAIGHSHGKHKFGQVALKALGYHPRCTLDTHDQSLKHSTHFLIKENQKLTYSGVLKLFRLSKLKVQDIYETVYCTTTSIYQYYLNISYQF